MDDNSRDRLTLARLFLEPSNSTHRQYEALRAFFVEGVPSAEAARRFGYTPGSFRDLVHQFRNQLKRDFFVPSAREGRPPGKQERLREHVVTLRKQNLSVHDISRALAREGESLSPAAVAVILEEEGFARLPRRPDDEWPDQPRPVVADVTDVRRLGAIAPVPRISTEFERSGPGMCPEFLSRGLGTWSRRRFSRGLAMSHQTAFSQEWWPLGPRGRSLHPEDNDLGRRLDPPDSSSSVPLILRWMALILPLA